MSFQKRNIKYRNIQCCNCGKKGHVYKKCFQPITSIGILCFYTPKNFNIPKLKSLIKRGKLYKVPRKGIPIADSINSNLKCIMIRRKDSLSFAEFARGKYNPTEPVYISQLISNFTKSEYKIVLNAKKFDDIWYHLWTSKKASRNRHVEYERSKKKYDDLVKGMKINGNKYNLYDILNGTNPKWDEPEWGFPKGRRAPRETDRECAVREFKEETDIHQSKINILPIDPIEEVFVGSNNVKYRHIYFIANITEWVEPAINISNKQQTAEVSSLGWFSPTEIISRIRDNHNDRKKLFLAVANFLSNYINN